MIDLGSTLLSSKRKSKHWSLIRPFWR